MREVRFNHLPEKQPDAMNDEKLDAILQSAHVDFHVANGFRQSVWSRIEAESSKPGFLEGFWTWMTRPPGIATGVAAMAVIGLFLGAVSVPKPADARLSYVESISPFIHLGGR
jgi:hypothetical protein